MSKAKTKKAVTKKNTAKKKNRLVVFWEKYTTQILVGLAILAVAGYWFGSVKLPAIQEKRDLDASYVELQEIADKISAVEEPDSREEEKYCSYSSAKFEKGDLSCTVEIEVGYKNRKLDDFNQIKKGIVNSLIVSGTAFSDIKLLNEKFQKDIKNVGDNILATEISKLEQCRISFSLSNNNEILIVKLSCVSFFAKAEHYPVKD